jgi:hypothetical protein
MTDLPYEIGELEEQDEEENSGWLHTLSASFKELWDSLAP